MAAKLTKMPSKVGRAAGSLRILDIIYGVLHAIYMELYAYYILGCALLGYRYMLGCVHLIAMSYSHTIRFEEDAN
jgi:hypothetical protein